MIRAPRSDAKDRVDQQVSPCLPTLYAFATRLFLLKMNASALTALLKYFKTKSRENLPTA
jgi:hypothetical protein